MGDTLGKISGQNYETTKNVIKDEHFVDYFGIYHRPGQRDNEDASGKRYRMIWVNWVPWKFKAS